MLTYRTAPGREDAVIRKIACLAVMAIAAMGVAGPMAQTYPDRPMG